MFADPFAELSSSGTYRWLQYNLERDVNTGLLLPVLAERDRQCLFSRRGQGVSASTDCPPTTDHVSLVHTPGELGLDPQGG